MKEVKLFGMWRSPFSSRVEIALKLKGVQYEYIEEDLSNKSPQLLQYNPVHKKVPVLLHNGKPIAESLVILEYIDETWETNPLLPRDPYQKARARFWAKFIDDKCWPPLPIAYRSIGEEEQEKAREEACELLKFLESELKDKKFFGGDSIGLVDIAGSLIAFWVRVIQEFLGIDLLTKEKFPNLWNWAEELVNCSIVKETLPPKERVFESFRSRSTRV